MQIAGKGTYKTGASLAGRLFGERLAWQEDSLGKALRSIKCSETFMASMFEGVELRFEIHSVCYNMEPSCIIGYSSSSFSGW